MFEPNVVVLYVDNVRHSSAFYKELFGISPFEDSPTFHGFSLTNGMIVALKARDTVEPPVTQDVNGGELAFTLPTADEVDLLFTKWQQRDIKMAQNPTMLPYGYTFVALDPDGTRLRVVALNK